MRALGWCFPRRQEIGVDSQWSALRSTLRLSFLRHGFLPQRETKRITPGHLADLPHPSKRRGLWNATLDRKISPVCREVEGLAWAGLESNQRPRDYELKAVS